MAGWAGSSLPQSALLTAGGIGIGTVFSGGIAAAASPLAVAGTVAVSGVIVYGATIISSAGKNADSDFKKATQQTFRNDPNDFNPNGLKKKIYNK